LLQDPESGREYPFVLDDHQVHWLDSDPGERGAVVVALLRTCLQRWPEFDTTPGFLIRLDTSDFRRPDPSGRPAKLGLGSSAAVLVALAGALAKLAGRETTAVALTELCCSAHRQFQGGRGSGADVLAALHGGLLTVEPGNGSPRVQTMCWPAGLELVAVWSGRAASTPELIGRFDSWRQTARTGPVLAALTDAAASAAQAWRTGATAQILSATATYAAALDRLDAEAGLGIVTSEHRRLAQISHRETAVYKTSGAGGGDLGFALTDQAVVASRLRDAFAAAGYGVLPLKIAAPGLTVTG
jgi:phosphomevalonate kinase